jgi:hypothetical protein
MGCTTKIAYKGFYLIFMFSLKAICTMGQADETLPYYQIPDYPVEYSVGNVLSRMIDGLGYRYYWATEGLSETDLQYVPSADGRSTLATIEHIFMLSEAIINAPKGQPNLRPVENKPQTFHELRKQTLLNLQEASALCAGKTAEEIATFKVKFKRGDKQYEFPFWNMINGQISDAIYHVGQIVILRRSSGNPVNSKMDVFLGKNRS